MYNRFVNRYNVRQGSPPARRRQRGVQARAAVGRAVLRCAEGPRVVHLYTSHFKMPPPPQDAPGPSRAQQRKAAKAMMYATSAEGTGADLSSRRHFESGGSAYIPRVGGRWQGKAWGHSSTTVSGR